jgi:branched-chain amino acid transport system ATP-binding protein
LKPIWEEDIALLQINDLHTYYGSIRALRGVSISVQPGQIVTLIGANGAGKTTLLRTTSGLVSPAEGSITFEGRRIDGLSPHRIVRMGICQVPEGRGLFPDLTVWENLRMGAYTLRDKRQIDEGIASALEMFPRLSERIHQKAGTMSGGEQQMLAVARALVLKPRLLMLDEPSLGLAPILVDQVFAKIQEINDGGTTILLVEQNARRALTLADEGYVLRTGEIILHDIADKLMENPLVKESYLGG